MKQHNSCSFSLVFQRRKLAFSKPIDAVSDEFCHWSGLKRVENRLTGAKSVGGLGEGEVDRLEKEEEEGRLAGRRREGAAPRRARMSASIHPCGRRCTTRPAASHDASTMPRAGYFELHAQVTRITRFEACLKLSGRNSSAKSLWVNDSWITDLDNFFFQSGTRFCDEYVLDKMIFIHFVIKEWGSEEYCFIDYEKCRIF